MSVIKRPATLEAFRDLVTQALFEVEELRLSIEYDEEFMEEALGFVEPLEKALRELQDDLNSGNYQFGGEALSYMPMIERQPNVLLPFKTLLRQINDTHIKGLQKDEED